MRASLSACSRPIRRSVLAVAAGLAVTACQHTATTPADKNASGISPVAESRPPEPKVAGSPPQPKIVQRKIEPKIPLPPKKPREVRIALLLPLSGPENALGESLLNAALLAQFEVADNHFLLAPFDTGGTPEGGADAASQAVAAGADLVIGPVFSDVVRSAASVVLAAGLNMLAFSNDSAVARPGVFLAGLLPETQIEKVVGFASRRGLRRYAALLPVSPFGERVQQALKETVGRNGHKVVFTRYFGQKPEDIRSAVGALARIVEQHGEGRTGPQSFDALFVAARGAQLTQIAAELGSRDIDGEAVQILGLSGWDEDNAGFEPALAGAWFATVPASFATEFSREFEARFRTRPHSLGRLSYDMVALAAMLAASGKASAFERKVLTDRKGFAGVSGVFRFGADGRPDHLLEVREIQPRHIILLDPGPTEFGVLSN